MALPLLLGLALGESLLNITHTGEVASVILFLLVVSGIVCLYFSYKCSLRGNRFVSIPVIGLGVFLFLSFFLFGTWRSVSSWNAVKVKWASEPMTYRVVLVTTPQIGARWVRVDAQTLDIAYNYPDASKKVRLMIQRDSLSERLQVGDALTFHARIQELTNKETMTFDYARYMKIKGFSGQAFLNISRWHCESVPIYGVPLMLRARIFALKIRDKLVSLYKQANLSTESLALFSALTLGERSELDNETKELYSDVGVSHVLALSGMHLSFLVAVFNLLLLRFCRRSISKLLGVGLILFFVWSYTFIAGLPTSLVRASVMYSLMLLGSLLGREGFSLNSLCVSAVLMLTVSPMLLWDVGFRLSFLAMFGILWLYPRCVNHPVMQWRYTKWVVQSMLVSFSAQLFTIPLVAFVFGTFAPYSALATLVITPLTALLIYLMPVLVLAVSTNILVVPVAFMIDCLVGMQNGVLRFFAKLPYSVINIDYSAWTLWAIYALLIVLLLKNELRLVAWMKCMLVAMIILFLTLVIS